MTGEKSGVRHRLVFYIPGFDPFPARRYRELYRSEAAAQSLTSGHSITLTADGTDGWRVTATTADAQGPVQVEFVVLGWSDIVQASMGHGIGATYRQLARTVAVYVGTGAIWRILRLRKGPAIAALYPVAMLLLQLVIAAGTGLAAAALLWRMAAIAALAAGAIMVWVVLWLFRRIDHRLYAYYLMHDYAFSAGGAGAMPAALQPRVAAFADRIAAAMQASCDEVLVVGHSSGAHLAIAALAQIVRAGQVSSGTGPALSLLTLGQVVPMVSFLPRAGDLRADLATLAASDALTWVDVTAPGDGCSFALCDPVAVSGVSPPGARWPLVLSAAFTRTLTPARWRELRWRFFRLHFQYLCAFDALAGRADDYDYFAITAGDRTLGARFAGRAASPGRIATPLSGYRSVAGGCT